MSTSHRRWIRPVLVLAGTLALPAIVPAQSLDSLQHVKASDARARAVLAEGYERSPTFREVVSDLERSDWMVFVISGECPRRTLFGCMLHTIGDFSGRRYLRILVNVRKYRGDALIGTLAHELEHANEVAHAPEVVDVPSLDALFARIGYVTRRERTTEGWWVTVYETVGAQKRGEAVLRELRGN